MVAGRENYFGNANEHRENVVQMDGMFAGNYNDYNINRTGLSTEAIEDTQVKTGGVDASSPMGMSLVINMVSKSGGNQFHGSIGGDYQPLSWNDNNAPEGGSPSIHAVHQSDYSFGGPIKKDRTWFFSAFRKSDIIAGTGRSAAQLSALQTFAPGVPLDDSHIVSNMPFVKVTTKVGANHTLAGVFQSDRLLQINAGPINYQNDVLATGGQMYGAKLTSVWSPHVNSTFTFNYNNKGGNSPSAYDGILGTGPQVNFHQTASLNTGILQGSGILAQGGNLPFMALDNSSLMMFRGDVNAFKEGWAGSHEFAFGFLLLPRSVYETENDYLKQRVHSGGAEADRSEQCRGGDGAVPPPVRDERAQPADGEWARPRQRHLRPGQLEADLASHGQLRRPGGFSASIRRAPQSSAPVERRGGAAPRLRVRPHRRREKRAARKLGPLSPPVDGWTRPVRGVRRQRRGGVSRYVRHRRQRHVLDVARHSGETGGDLVPAVRSEFPRAVHGRARPRLPASIPGTAERGHRRRTEDHQGQLRPD